MDRRETLELVPCEVLPRVCEPNVDGSYHHDWVMYSTGRIALKALDPIGRGQEMANIARLAPPSPAAWRRASVRLEVDYPYHVIVRKLFTEAVKSDPTALSFLEHIPAPYPDDSTAPDARRFAAKFAPCMANAVHAVWRAPDAKPFALASLTASCYEYLGDELLASPLATALLGSKRLRNKSRDRALIHLAALLPPDSSSRKACDEFG